MQKDPLPPTATKSEINHAACQTNPRAKIVKHRASRCQDTGLFVLISFARQRQIMSIVDWGERALSCGSGESSDKLERAHHRFEAVGGA